jgi:hypothetical protein
MTQEFFNAVNENTKLKADIIKLKNEKLAYQLFIGKVSEEIGVSKTMLLLKQSKEAIK